MGFYRCRGTQLFEGDGIFLSRHCREGACPVPYRLACACGEVEDTVHITTMPLGGKRNFSERSASVLIDTVGEARIW